jgi:hypothetical protein
MSLYVFAPAAAGAAAGALVVAGAPQLASSASAMNATVIVANDLEILIDFSLLLTHIVAGHLADFRHLIRL